MMESKDDNGGMVIPCMVVVAMLFTVIGFLVGYFVSPCDCPREPSPVTIEQIK